MAGPQPGEDRDLFYWLALSMAPGVGTIRFARLLHRFKTPEAVFNASPPELETMPRLPLETRRALTRFDWGHKVEEELSRVRRLGIRLVTLIDPGYPQRLKQIADPPPILWVAGDLGRPDQPAVAMVGSRSATRFGLETSARLGAELASFGINVVSGAALGIDASAHRGALSAGGTTTAVLGCGVDVIYPKANRDLFAEIPRSGALVSEFPLGVQPKPGHFPVRNRIIAGLSLAVVVVEAALKSGALITARLALEENREVLAVPGRPRSPRSRGTNELIRQGARLVETGRDIVEEIAPQLGSWKPEPKKAEPEPAQPAMQGPEKQIWDALGLEARHIDVLVRRLGLSPPQLAPVLLDMEIKGLIRQLPGARYVRN